MSDNQKLHYLAERISDQQRYIGGPNSIYRAGLAFKDMAADLCAMADEIARRFEPVDPKCTSQPLFFWLGAEADWA